MSESAAHTTVDTNAASLGKYIPFARIGEGGMADVSLAVARGPAGFNKLAVVKQLRNTGDDAHIRMFLDEARLSARLAHPNIVQTYDVGDAGGKYFIAMEYLEGKPLQAVLDWYLDRGEPLPELLAAYIAAQALKGLHYAHELADYDGSPLGIVHRDVSPQNLFVTYNGELKLLDFGIAKAAVNTSHTETGMLKGKIRYMAPEQVLEKSLDRRCDVFALGIVLWEMLARKRLFEGDSMTVLTKIVNEDPPSVTKFRPDVSPELDAIIIKALRRDLTERYANAEAMRIDLDRFIRGKGEGLDVELARVMAEAFTATRDAVRARVQSFLASVPVAVDPARTSGSLLSTGENLPALHGTDPNNSLQRATLTTGAAAVITGNTTATTPARPNLLRYVVIGAPIFALIALAVVALRPKGTPTNSPTGAAATQIAAASPTTAQVRLETTPPGALVEWNGRPVDRTPADFLLDPGTQTLTLSLEGYEKETVTLDARPGATIDRSLSLKVKKAPAAAAADTGARAFNRNWRPAPPPPPRATAKPTATATSTGTAKPNIRVLEEN